MRQAGAQDLAPSHPLPCVSPRRHPPDGTPPERPSQLSMPQGAQPWPGAGATRSGGRLADLVCLENPHFAMVGATWVSHAEKEQPSAEMELRVYALAPSLDDSYACETPCQSTLSLGEAARKGNKTKENFQIIFCPSCPTPRHHVPFVPRLRPLPNSSKPPQPISFTRAVSELEAGAGAVHRGGKTCIPLAPLAKGRGTGTHVSRTLPPAGSLVLG